MKVNVAVVALSIAGGPLVIGLLDRGDRGVVHAFGEIDLERRDALGLVAVDLAREARRGAVRVGREDGVGLVRERGR